jgi:hypothetical protein
MLRPANIPAIADHRREIMGCLANPLRGSTTTKRASDSSTRPNRLHTHTHSPKRLAFPRSPITLLSTLTARATHARPLHPTALVSVPSEIVLARVRVPRTVNLFKAPTPPRSSSAAALALGAALPPLYFTPTANGLPYFICPQWPFSSRSVQQHMPPCSCFRKAAM